jgi:N-acyl-D-aspartate/D-glutamate deacylase
MNLDVVIRNGRVFDGTGVPGAIRDLGIRHGVVVAVSTEPLDGEGAKEIDATGHWVLPGFVDVHTHYDAEVLAAPGLEESVRHGVTTVVMGSCSLSTILRPRRLSRHVQPGRSGTPRARAFDAGRASNLGRRRHLHRRPRIAPPRPQRGRIPRPLRPPGLGDGVGGTRRRGRVLQSAPDAQNPTNVLSFFRESRGWGRSALRTSLLVAADPKSVPGGGYSYAAIDALNRIFKADLKLQHVPAPFELYSDGIDLPVFEELGAGREALHLQDELARAELMADDTYRDTFRRQLRWSRPGLWHRDLYDAEIVACPDESVVGRSFGAVADERGIHPLDAFLDLLVEHGGNNVRWRTTVANHRPEMLERIAGSPSVQIGFSDAGAHLRNMAFYNSGLHLLRRVRDAERDGHPFMSVERAVHRLTGELSDWFGLDAGHLRLGDRADVVIVDPEHLDDTIDDYHEAPMPYFGGLSRMVRRNDDTVRATLVAGEVVFEDGAFAPGFGRSRRTGTFLRAGQTHRGSPSSLDVSPPSRALSEATR